MKGSVTLCARWEFRDPDAIGQRGAVAPHAGAVATEDRVDLRREPCDTLAEGRVRDYVPASE